jgi:hypothetical protein
MKNLIHIRVAYILCTESYGDSYNDSDTCRRLLSHANAYYELQVKSQGNTQVDTDPKNQG